MFERFTQQARQVVVFAQGEARGLGHEHVGTVHILLGLLREEQGLAGRALRSLDVTAERVRFQVVRIVGLREPNASGEIPFGPHTKQVFELAMREADSLGHHHIGTEHILLGLIDERAGLATHIFLEFDVDPDIVREGIIGAAAGARGESSGRQLGAAEREPRWTAYEPLTPPQDLELGWRSRPIALAMLGAAVLARRAFNRSETGDLEPLAMQLLTRLALALPGAPPELGESVQSLAIELVCEQHELYDAFRILADRGLATYEENVDDGDGGQLISITTAGFMEVERWLEQTARLFRGWPPDQPGVDDATG